MRPSPRVLIIAALVVICAAGLVIWGPSVWGYRDFSTMIRTMTLPPTPADRLNRFDRSQLIADLERGGFALGDAAFVRIFKEESRLDLYLQARGEDTFRLFKSFSICTYSGQLGPKLQEGDHQAPEGFYAVGPHQLNPQSRHHLSFNIGFPNAYDRSHGRTGSFLMVHGGCSSVGCYAMTDEQVDQIYALVEAALAGGQSQVDVHIFPFEMSAERVAQADGHEWQTFWSNLKQGYDYFETARTLPEVGVSDGKYVFDQVDEPTNYTPILAWDRLPDPS